MQPWKNIIGIVATLLVFIGYIPYIKDIIKGKTKPHMYSWFVWGISTLIAFGLQFSGSAGIGSLVTLAAGLICFLVIGLGFKYKVKVKITQSDTIFLILSLFTLVLWLLAHQPVLSSILITIIGLLGFVPTVRKSWQAPYSETLSFYFINTFRFLLNILALPVYTIVTALYPITWFLTNGLFALVLILRRKCLLQNN